MQDALAGHDERRGAQADLVVLGHFTDAGKRFFDDAHRARIDLGCFPTPGLAARQHFRQGGGQFIGGKLGDVGVSPHALDVAFVGRAGQ